MAASTSGEARPRVSTAEEEEGEGEGEGVEAALAATLRDGDVVDDAIGFTEIGAPSPLRFLFSVLSGTERTRRLPRVLMTPGAGAARLGPEAEAKETNGMR